MFLKRLGATHVQHAMLPAQTPPASALKCTEFNDRILIDSHWILRMKTRLCIRKNLCQELQQQSERRRRREKPLQVDNVCWPSLIMLQDTVPSGFCVPRRQKSSPKEWSEHGSNILESLESCGLMRPKDGQANMSENGQAPEALS